MPLPTARGATRRAALAAFIALAAGAATANTTGTPVDALVIEAAGMRLKLRADDGREFWVTVPERTNAQRVGQRLQGLAVPKGDTVQVLNPVFVPAK